MPKVYTVNKARTARRKHGIRRGDKYYWWATRRTVGKQYVKTKHYSKTYPRRSRLATSPFERAVALIQESLEDTWGSEEAEVNLENAACEVETLKEQTEESLENIPEGLKDAATATLIKERVDQLEQWSNALRELMGQASDDESPAIMGVSTAVALCPF